MRCLERVHACIYGTISSSLSAASLGGTALVPKTIINVLTCSLHVFKIFLFLRLDLF